ncbi:hypothetical protein AM1_3292 [Acaryochloris marina MBIC11017]|uniref:Uncharacterized protein n=1 Tax=Acaryochloris marina (strain MBIC 11017) TaxID=329726 RepID=B0BYY6_ACAM1|nr:hypothetical protein AM1_3292 [Acaryochloris marina MBIC11017]
MKDYTLVWILLWQSIYFGLFLHSILTDAFADSDQNQQDF